MPTRHPLLLTLFLSALLPLSLAGNEPHARKTDSPVLASIGIRSLSVEH